MIQLPPVDPQAFGTILITAFVTATATAILSFIFSGILTYFLIFKPQKRFESELTREIEKFKAELSSDLQKEHIRLTTTYPKLVLIVDDLQSKLVRVERWLADDLDASWPPEDKRPNPFNPDNISQKETVKRLNDSATDYRNLVFEKVMYLPEQLGRHLIGQNVLLSGIVRALEVANLDDDGDNLEIHQIKAYVKEVLQEFNVMGNMIRQGFRKLLDGETGDVEWP